VKNKSIRVVFLSTLAFAVIAVAACHSSSSGSSALVEGGTPGGGACTDVTTCTGYGSPCYKSVTCTDGKCAFQLQSPGYSVPDAQTPFDCHYVACDNFGNVKSMPDDLDRPDAGPCQTIFCVDGEMHTPEPSADGTPCGTGLVCTAGVCGAAHD
jgi:hypothetical protein